MAPPSQTPTAEPTAAPAGWFDAALLLLPPPNHEADRLAQPTEPATCRLGGSFSPACPVATLWGAPDARLALLFFRGLSSWPACSARACPVGLPVFLGAKQPVADGLRRVLHEVADVLARLLNALRDTLDRRANPLGRLRL